VTTTKTDSEVIELVLASFQKELRPFRRSLSARMADRSLFRPRPMPVVAYARHYSAADESETGMSGPVLGFWRITPDTVERMPTDFSTRNRYCSHAFLIQSPGQVRPGRVGFPVRPALRDWLSLQSER